MSRFQAPSTGFDASWVYVAGSRARDAPSISLPHQQAQHVGHIALDIGGSLIKLVYFSPEGRVSEDDTPSPPQRNPGGACPSVLPVTGASTLLAPAEEVAAPQSPARPPLSIELKV